jgi:hypothetical protein
MSQKTTISWVELCEVRKDSNISEDYVISILWIEEERKHVTNLSRPKTKYTSTGF